MSKLLENKQIVHIATEIVVLIGITFYFSSKNKKLLEHIEDLSQRLEEQEDMIQKHEQIINHLVQVINNRPDTGHGSNNAHTSKPQVSHISAHKQRRRVKDKHTSLQISNKKRLSPPPIHEYDDDEQVSENEDHEDETSEDDSELDAEIADELNELKGSLKKEE